MEDTQDELYIAAGTNLTDQEADVAFDLLNQIYDEQIEQHSGENSEIIQPHVEIAHLFASTVRIQSKLNGTRAILSEAMSDCDSATDAMLRAQDLVQALETVSVMLNRIYYGSVDLVMELGHDKDLYNAAVKAAEQMLEASSGQTETCDTA